MDENERPVTAQEQGLRRRQSTQHDDDFRPVTSDEGRRPSQTQAPIAVRRTASDPEQVTVSMSSAVDQPTSPANNALLPRVRYSDDMVRDASAVDGPSSSSVSSALGSATHPAGSDPARNSRGPPLSLTINTRDIASIPTVLDQGMAKSTSPRSPSLSPSPGHLSPLQTSPITPSGRSRGHSLRRALFSRGLQDQASTSGSVIELEAAGPSNPDTTERRAEADDGKKSGETTVTVTPTADDELSDVTIQQSHRKPVRLSNQKRGYPGLPNSTWAQFAGAVESLRMVILRIQQIPPSKDGRHIDLDAMRQQPLIDERTGKDYINNTIRSSRYTLWNFLPRQLFAQFSKLANLSAPRPSK